MRYVTNKPKLDVTEGNVNAGYAYTSGGDPSSSVEAMINLPLIPDTLAVRGVIYDDTRSGYINNVPGVFSRLPSDLGIHYANYATACSAGIPVNGQCAGGAATSYGDWRVRGIAGVFWEDYKSRRTSTECIRACPPARRR